MPNKDIDTQMTVSDNSGTNERTNERTELLCGRTHNDRDDQHQEYHHNEWNQCNTDSEDGNWWEPSQCSSGETIIVLEHHPNDSRIRIDSSGTIQTLTGRMGTGGGNVPMVIEIRYAERK